VAGIRKLEDGLKKLDKMTNEEARMANAEVLKVAHTIDKKVEGVDEKVQGVGNQVKVVGKKVEVVEAKVQMVIDGAQTVRNWSSTPSLTLSRLDGKETAMEAKMIMQQTADKLDHVMRSSLVPSSLVEYLTRSQEGNCENALENGNLRLIRPQTTKSHANVNTKEQRSGSAKAASLRVGKWPVPCCGSTGNVRPSYPCWLR
jgi:hypothetical protein